MDVSIFLDYISPSTFVLILVLYIIGMFLKSIPKIKDWTIPFIILALGVILSCLIMGFGVEAFIQGVLVSGVTVLFNELIKQGAIKRKED